MATVKFSESLKRDILSKAHDMFTAKINSLKENIDNSLVTDAWNNFYGQYAESLDKLPDEFFMLNKDVSIRPESSEKYRNVTSSSIRVPRVFHTANSLDTDRFYFSSGHYPTLRVKDHPDNAAYFREAERISTAVEAQRAKRDKFVKGVNQVIEAYTTLAPALKVFPALWDLLPEETKQRHRRVVERKKPAAKEDIAEQVDVNELTSIVTISKLTS